MDSKLVEYLSKRALHFSSLLVTIALLDFILTWLRVRQIYDMTNVPFPWPNMWSPTVHFEKPFLLLVASTSIWLGVSWSYLVSLVVSGRLIYKEGLLFQSFWGEEPLRWTWSDFGWDIIRTVLGVVVLMYAMISLLKAYRVGRQKVKLQAESDKRVYQAHESP